MINILAGLVKPDSGRIAVAGKLLFDSSRSIDLTPERRRIGYVFQEGRLFPHLNVRGNLIYGLQRVPRDERRIELEQVVRLLGLDPFLHRRPSDLSGGEKQRVALGRALLANPHLMLMDEPLAALDQPRKEEVMPFIERLRDELTIPIVYVSHAMDEVVRLADTLVLLSEGRTVAVGPLDELTSRLDLRPLTGRYEAGAVIDATVVRQDQAFALSELAFSGGILQVPHIDLPPGSQLRVRLRARDIALALERPENTSILNVFSGVIRDMSDEPGAQVDVLLDVGGTALWARVTARSRHDLNLRIGSRVYALVKAVAIDRHTLGRTSGRRFLANKEIY